MTPEIFKKIRKSFGTQEDMADLLEVTAKTISNWEAGRNTIPGFVAVGLQLLIERHGEITSTIVERIKAKIELDWPDGIQSVQEVEE